MNIYFEVSEEGMLSIKYDKPMVRNKGTSLLDQINKYCVIDIETTGFNTRFDDIIEVGALKVVDNNVVETFVSLVYCESIPEHIAELTGITSEMALSAPKLPIVLKEFLEFIGDDILIAHNAHFDINFLYDEILLHHKKEFNNNFVDTLRLSRKIYPEYSSHKLSVLSEELNLQSKPVHRSLSDCYVAYDLYNKCIDKVVCEKIDLNSKRKSGPRKEEVKAKNILANGDSYIDENNPLYDKSVVFTGTLAKMVRKEAMQLVVNIGGRIEDNVTAKTDYLVLGTQDYRRLKVGEESSKTRKAKALIAKGKNINIISENDFYEIALDITINEKSS